MVGLFDAYDCGDFFDEVVGPDGSIRPHYQAVADRLSEFAPADLADRERLRDEIFRSMGITFTVYGEEHGVERTFPMDLVPRIIPGGEWDVVAAGLRQRVDALNLFLTDLYEGDQETLHDGIVPRWLVASATGWVPEVLDITVPNRARIVVAGVDLVRDRNGIYRVLEDNLRVPSGISYVVENRAAMKRVLPRVFGQTAIEPVEHYGPLLRRALEQIAPPGAGENPRAVVLTPGAFNSAYFEHAFLARQMGVELVEGRDLLVEDQVVKMRTTRGLQRVDVVYRRVDDDYLDPLVFDPRSVLGVPGLMSAVREGNVTLANAVGNGVADDKAVYPFVDDLIRHFTGDEPIIPNVPTYLLWDPDQRAHVLDRLDELVVKPVAESGGYGLLVGPSASDEDIERTRRAILDRPRNWIAQEVVQLSRHPTLVGDRLEGRHVDLRPFIVCGEEATVFPGGLTRVALRKDSLVVNSSQGGGSKDTWVMREPAVVT